MGVIGLCTAASRLKLAVSVGGRTIEAQRKVFNQERVLFSFLKKKLSAAGGTLAGTELVCAVRGPGRFTGIRISLTLAATLKALAGARVLTATLFEVLALQAAECADFRRRKAAGPLAVLLHAFKDEYFLQFFRTGKSGPPRPEGPPAWLPEEGARSALAARGAGLYMIADEEEKPGIYSLAPSGSFRAPASLSRVLPGYIIKAAKAGNNSSLTPLYLKPAKYELQNNISYGRGRRLKGQA